MYLICIDMKVIYNNLIPFKGFKCINICGFLFARKGCVIDERCLNHERIHTAQMKEMLYVFFYLWYFVEWVVRLFGKGNAYRNVSFEREAYMFENDCGYLSRRHSFTWRKFL